MMDPAKARAEGRTIRLASQMVDLANPGQLLGTPRTANGVKNDLRDPDAIGSPRGRIEDQVAKLLPTATTQDVAFSSGGTFGKSLGQVARESVDLLPTPLANEGEKAWIGKRESKGQKYLSHIIGEKLLPTPNTMDSLPARSGVAMERQLRRGQGPEASRRSSMGNLREDILQTVDPGIFKRDLLPTPKASDGHLEHRRENSAPTAASISAPAWGAYEPAIRRWEQVNGEAPPPTELTQKGKHRLNASFAEWMMGLPPGWVTDVDISRNDQLKAIGNGVCPQQAIAALTDMLQATGNGGFFDAQETT